jgi:predicted Zn finger-like uncharacterized protein
MGEDAPEAVILTCPGCSTQFRLKPKKGRLPDGPVACPKCATDIPVVERNLSEAADDAGDAAQHGTLQGNGVVAPSAKLDDDEDFPDEHSFADINLSENASRKTGPKQTFLGMGPSSLKAVIDEEASKSDTGESKQLVDRDNLSALRESSVVDESADDGGFNESPKSGRLRRPRKLDEAEESDEYTRETSEQKAVTESDLRETAEGDAYGSDGSADFNEAVDEPLSEPVEHDDSPTQVSERPDFAETAERDQADDSDDEDAETENGSPKKQILGKLKLKKKLARRLKKNIDKDKKREEQERADKEQADDGPGETGAAAEDDADQKDDVITVDSDDQKTGKKPSLSELLKKAREKSKRGSGLPRPRQSTSRNERPQPTGEKLDRALQDIADETAAALTDESDEGAEQSDPERRTERLGSVGGTERLGKVSGPDGKAGKKKSSKEMMDLLRRKVAEKDQPGAASERRGSGYIRLPTAEIQDVLGQGTYRLRVEDIVYEPVDKKGLTTLIKRGVLLGAAEIAEADGDWMPVQEHPVFHELRRKMAKEAHDLLADYRAEPEDATTSRDSADQAAPPPKPSGQRDATAPKTETMSEADAAGIPTMEAELEEESEAEVQDEAADASQPTEAEQFAATFDLPKSESSIEFPEPEQEDTRDAAGPPADRHVDEPSSTETASEQPSPAQTPKSYPAIDATQGPPGSTDESGAPEDVEEVSAPSSGGRGGLIAAIALVVVGGLVVALALSPIGRPYVEEYLGPIGGSTGDETGDGEAKGDKVGDAAKAEKISKAVEEASTTLSDAARIRLSNADEVSSFADEMVENDNPAAAATLLGAVRESAPDDPARARRHIDILIEAERFTEARREMAALVAGGMDAEAFSDVFAQSTKSDPALGAYEPITLRAGDNADSLRAYPTWEQMNFKVVEAGSVTGIFKPSQEGWEDGWRDEVAAWRLCEIMTCHFDVPRNRVAKVSRAQLEELLKAGQSEAQDDYRKQLERLDWRVEESNGGQTEFVWGTLKAWPGEWAPFPIELTDVWRPWLSTPGADLDQPPREALSELKNVQDGRFYRAIVDELDGATTRRLARELSTILVFDYLTNNWDRFVSDDERFGVNNAFADGHFVSLNNGTAFQTRDSTRVKGRFSWTSRFSASTIASLRLLEPEFVSNALYPDPTGLDEAKLDVFWGQRDRALERVEELTNARGRDAVIAFD